MRTMSDKKLIIPFNALLNTKDMKSTIYMCRQNKLNICGINGLLNNCTFTHFNGICQKPSRAWKRQYNKLKG